MALKLDTWIGEERQKAELQRRLQNSIKGRVEMEKAWRESERIVFTVMNVDESGAEKVALGDGTGVDDAFTAQPRISINTTFKNYRFLHSQMSANPPTVVCRPTSEDLADKRSADAADRLIRYAIRQFQLQELMDRCNGHALLYGTGFVKMVWNPDAGAVLEFNEETGEILCEGAIEATVPLPWNIYLDPDASTWNEVRFVLEKLYMSYDEALSMFPDKAELLEKLRNQTRAMSGSGSTVETEPSPTFLKQQHFDVVEIFQYWEKGLAVNGMQGRFCYCTAEGDLLSPLKTNPHRFAPVKAGSLDKTKKSAIEIAKLPYNIITDIDNPCAVWGRSTVVYAAPIQDVHNALMNVMIENARAHGVARLLMHEDTEVADDSITNSAYDVVRWTGTRAPEYQKPMEMPAAMEQLIGLAAAGIDNMFGVNEANFGQQSREQSGFSMQYAVSQSNSIRRRLFNKYTLLVENVFKSYLDLVRKHWTDERTIYVLGKEKAFESLDIKGADIEGGFDLVVEYGASLSLDPVSRRQELITMLPLFEKAGVDTGDLLRLMKLSELEGAYDLVQLAADRQQEIFDEIESTGQPAMLKYAYDYVMTAHFRDLDPSVQKLIDDHIKAREQMAAKSATMHQPAQGPGANPAGTPPGPQTVPGAAAMAGGLPGAPGQGAAPPAAAGPPTGAPPTPGPQAGNGPAPLGP